MRILASRTPVSAYLTVLLCSVVYWLRVGAGAKKECLPKTLQAEFLSAVAEAEAFCRKHRLPLKSYREYTSWIASNPPDDDEELATVLLDNLNALRVALPKIKRDDSVSDLELQTINRIRLWHRSENPSTLEAIRSAVGKLDVPAMLVQHFAVDKRDPAPLLKELKAVVRRLTGVESYNVPLEDQAELRQKYPSQWSTYLAVRRELTVMYRQELRDLVRENGGPIDIDAARKYFARRGLPNRLPKTFDGLVGEDGNLLTRHGSALKTGTGGDVNNIDPAAKIVMNPKYNPKLDTDGAKGDGNWVFKAVLPTKKAGTDKNNEQYFYTGERHLKNREHKFGVVDDLLKNEVRMVARWRKDLAGKDIGRKIMAAQCELAYETCARIGGRDNQNRNGQTFGLTTLLVGNVKRRGNSLILDYVGKDSVQQRHTLKPDTLWMRQIIKLLLTLCEDKARKDLLWTYDGTEYNAARMRAYFRTVSGVPEASPHKLRHLRGTRLATTELELVSEKLAKRRGGVDQRVVDAAFKEALTTVGNLLGHVKGVGVDQKTTWSTAAKNYVSPIVMDEFYTQWRAQGIRPPAFLAKLKG